VNHGLQLEWFRLRVLSLLQVAFLGHRYFRQKKMELSEKDGCWFHIVAIYDKLSLLHEFMGHNGHGTYH
jgi:hypothetical protein